MSLNILILGSNSEIAQAFLEELIKQEEKIAKIYFCSSNPADVERFSNHIQVRYNLKDVQIFIIPYNITENDAEDVLKPFKDVNLLFSAIGLLGENSAKGLFNMSNTRRVLQINFTKHIEAINVLTENMLQHKQRSHIIVLSSVAGERGRQSNFIYGSAKAGLTAYLSGLRNFLNDTNIHVTTVLPGFMATKMTSGMTLNPKLTLQPRQAGLALYKAYKSRKNVVYIKGIWRYIMLIIKNIPEFIFKKLKM